MRLYLDEKLSPRVADLLRARGLDVVSAYEVGNTQLDDRAQLQYAVREGRAIVTCNVVDFVELAADAVARNAEHAGIIRRVHYPGPEDWGVLAKAQGAE